MRVTFTLQGFRTLIRKDIIVQLSQTIALNATLEQAALEEQVTVIGQSPLIDVKSTVKGQTMTKEVFMALPRNRSFDGLISTIPGVQYETVTGGLSVDGASGTENMWYMDGADITELHTRHERPERRHGAPRRGQGHGLRATTPSSAARWAASSTSSPAPAATSSTATSWASTTTTTPQLMQGKARDYFRWSPLRRATSTSTSTTTTSISTAASDRDNYKRFEGVFTPRRLHPQGQAVVLRLDQPDLFPRPDGQPVLQQRSHLRRRVRPSSPSTRRTLGFNGQIKLTAAPVTGLRVSASFVNNFRTTAAPSPASSARRTKTYDWGKEGFDYPNWTRRLPGRLQRQQQLPPQPPRRLPHDEHEQPADREPVHDVLLRQREPASTSDRPVLLGQPGACSTLPAPSTTAAPGRVQDAYKLEKISGNLDLSYFVSLAGEHAWKAGVQLSSAIRKTSSRPRRSPWSTVTGASTYTALEAYGDAGAPAATYGYYTSAAARAPRPTAASGTSTGNNYVRLPPGFLDDQRQADHQRRRPGRERVHPGVHARDRFPASTTEADQVRLRPTSWPPGFGAVYDVFGDSSLKIFGSFGIYYDVMKLYMAEGAFGGFKWQTDYYTLDDPDWRLIAASGRPRRRRPARPPAAPTSAPSTGAPSFDTLEPDMKPVAQQEDLLRRRKEAVGRPVLVGPRASTSTCSGRSRTSASSPPRANSTTTAIPAAPGSSTSSTISRTSRPASTIGTSPKATREYYGLNLSLEKRFSHNWQGGINYTLSLTTGNYGGLSATDEVGRNSPNVERYYDLWFMMYEMDGTAIDGPLPQDRTHYFKAYGSYTFPFGLTVGFVAYGRSGNPISTQLDFNNSYIYP